MNYTFGWSKESTEVRRKRIKSSTVRSFIP